MAMYQLKSVDDALWHRVRVRTTTEGISIKDVIVRALELYDEHGQAALWPDRKRKQLDVVAGTGGKATVAR